MIDVQHFYKKYKWNKVYCMRPGNFFLHLRNKIIAIPGIKVDCLTVQLHISSYWIVLRANSDIGEIERDLQTRGALTGQPAPRSVGKTSNGLIGFKIRWWRSLNIIFKNNIWKIALGCNVANIITPYRNRDILWVKQGALSGYLDGKWYSEYHEDQQ